MHTTTLLLTGDPAGLSGLTSTWVNDIDECAYSPCSNDEECTDCNFYPLVVVGAGPHALSLLSKLLEKSVDPREELPSNAFLFRPQKCGCHVIHAKHKILPQDYLDKNDKEILERCRISRGSKAQHAKFLKRVCVVDRNDGWMAQWKSQFETLEIAHLRSGLHAHPDPVDDHSMRIQLKVPRDQAVVTLMGLKRSTIFKGPFDLPRTNVFNSFCDDLVERYHLSEANRIKGTVQSVTPVKSSAIYSEHKKPTKSLFRVVLSDGRVLFAQHVVLAPGPLNIPIWPDFRDHLEPDLLSALPPGKLVHSNDIMHSHSDLTDENLFKAQRLLIVGGGLTAGHLSMLALRHNIGRVVVYIISVHAHMPSTHSARDSGEPEETRN
jgi:hypothetical protein